MEWKHIRLCHIFVIGKGLDVGFAFTFLGISLSNKSYRKTRGGGFNALTRIKIETFTCEISSSLWCVSRRSIDNKKEILLLPLKQNSRNVSTKAEKEKQKMSIS